MEKEKEDKGKLSRTFACPFCKSEKEAVKNQLKEAQVPEPSVLLIELLTMIGSKMMVGEAKISH